MKKKVLILVLAIIMLLPLKAWGQGSPLSVDVIFVSLALEGGNLRVSEGIRVTNTGAAPYSGETIDGQQISLQVALPQGYTNLSFQDISEAEVVKTDEGVAIKKPIQPGENEIRYSYMVAGGNSFNIGRKFPYPLGAFYIITKEPTLSVQSGTLAKGAELAMGGVSYKRYAAENIAADQTIEAVVQVGAPEPAGEGAAAGAGWTKKILFISITVTVAAAAALLIIFMRRKGGADDKPTYEELKALLKRAKRQYRLFEDKLASADQEHQEGLKEKLSVLKKKIRQLEISIESYHADDAEDEDAGEEYRYEDKKDKKDKKDKQNTPELSEWEASFLEEEGE